VATQLTVINNVLRRLREDTVSTPTESDYSTLLAMWVNDGIRSLTDQYYWESLIHEVTFELAASTATYDLSATTADGGVVTIGERPTNEHSMLEWDRTTNKPSAFLFDTVSDNDFNAQLRLISETDRTRKFQGQRDQTNADPTDFSLKLNPEGDGYDFTVWPLPSAARTVRIKFWTPQLELASTDDTDTSTDIILNSAVVEAYVHMIASNERGEEMGEPGNVLERRYLELLGAAMEAPIRTEERENRYESIRS
jgi:hypothetical protein